ncbi:DUF4192 family protein [Nesterenkonia sp. CF4.4]|uniref:DUF4192 family protein n=1 Tax=Nesterenkonia sp. CF4.4 TaxID=3373079 RepID=UPI003EE65095
MDAHTPAQHLSQAPAQSAPAPIGEAQGPLSIQDPGDCMALVRHTFGRLPQQSLIVIGLLQGYTGGHMRIDLQPALRDPFTSARLVADCLAGEGSCPTPEAALVVLIGDDPVSPEQDEQWRACLDALTMMLDSEYCVRIVQTWFVSGDHVRDPLCTDLGCCDLPGRHLSDLRVPNLGGPLGAGPGREAPPLDRAADTFLAGAPAADPALIAHLAESRRDHPQRQDKHAPRGLLHAWDLALRQQLNPTPDSGGDSVEPAAQAERLTMLLGQLRTGFGRDLLIPLATLSIDHALLGLHLDERAGEEPVDPVEEVMLQDYAKSFFGETGRRPDWPRVDALEAVLRELVPYAHGAERENLLCLMGWIEWVRGRGSAAGSFVDRCLAEFPDNGFSQVIESLMQFKGVCLWARVKQHSWSWSRNSMTGPD